MTKDELIKRLSDSYDQWLVDGDTFMGSPTEASYADGKADAYSDALAWVENYFRTI